MPRLLAEPPAGEAKDSGAPRGERRRQGHLDVATSATSAATRSGARAASGGSFAAEVRRGRGHDDGREAVSAARLGLADHPTAARTAAHAMDTREGARRPRTAVAGLSSHGVSVAATASYAAWSHARRWPSGLEAAVLADHRQSLTGGTWPAAMRTSSRKRVPHRVRLRGRRQAPGWWCGAIRTRSAGGVEVKRSGGVQDDGFAVDARGQGARPGCSKDGAVHALKHAPDRRRGRRSRHPGVELRPGPRADRATEAVDVVRDEHHRRALVGCSDSSSHDMVSDQSAPGRRRARGPCSRIVRSFASR